MYTFHAAYPTLQHERAAERIVEFFAHQSDVQAVLLTCSCARGKATRDSCLDIAVLVKPEALVVKRHDLEQMWKSIYQTDPTFQTLQAIGKYSHVDLEFMNGLFEPMYHGWTTGPDEFELAIGNLLAYSVSLWEQGDYLRQLYMALPKPTPISPKLGSHFEFFTNDEFVGEADDSEFSSGIAGLVIGFPNAEDKAVFEFDNFELGTQ